MNKTWGRTAMRFSSADYVARQRMLGVTFENGDRFFVATETLLPAANGAPTERNGARPAPSADPDWSKLRIGPTGDVIEIPNRGSVIEIPWDRIRSLVDPAFRAHLTKQAGERARRIGARLRALRLKAGLTRPALANKAGVERGIIAKLEAGKMDGKLDLLVQISAALGGRLRDFAKVE